MKNTTEENYQVKHLYKNSAQKEESWNRSNWSCQENQEAGFRQIKEYLVEHGSIESLLDVGCGDGKIIDWLPGSILDYTGIDITKEIVEFANNPRIIEADVKTYQPERKFDAVIAIGSFNIGVPFHQIMKALKRMDELSTKIMICNISYLNKEKRQQWDGLIIKDERKEIEINGYTLIEHPHSFSNGYGDQYTIIKTK